MGRRLSFGSLRAVLAIVILAMVLGGCAGTIGSARYPNSQTPEAKASLDSIRALYNDNKLAEADRALQKFIDSSPYTELTDEARFLRGEIAFMRKNYDKAIELYRQSYSQVVSEAIAPKAEFKAALAMSNLGRHSDAISELSVVARARTSPVLRMRIDSLAIRSSMALKSSPKDSIVWYLRLLDDYAEVNADNANKVPKDESVREEAALSVVKKWIEDHAVLDSDLAGLPAKEMKGKRSGGFIVYKQAFAARAAGDNKKSDKLLKSFVSNYEKHDMLESAKSLLAQADGVNGDSQKTISATIGLIVPLEGKFSEFGESVLHGAECALGVTAPCIGPKGVKLIIKKAGDSVAENVQAVEELAREGAIAIIGPMLSSTVEDAAKKAEELGVPLISLSQKSGVAEIGGFIFRNSISTQGEMDAVADYATSTKGFKRFLVFYPNSKKGGEYRQLFSDAIGKKGGSIVGQRTYSPRSLGFLAAMLKAKGSGKTPEEFDRQLLEQTGGGRVDGVIKPGSVVPDGAANGEELLELPSGGKGYDAVFIPDDAGTVNFIASNMELSHLERVPMIGISRWDDDALLGKGGKYVNDAIFAAPFFKESLDPQVSTFVSQFTTAYGKGPTLLEALGFDSMRAVTASIISKGAKSRSALKDALMKLNDFPGISGLDSFNSDGDAVRKFQILTVDAQTIRLAK